MKRAPTIVVAEPDGFSAAAQALLSQLGSVRLGPFDRAALTAAVQDCDILWVRLAHAVDRELLNAGRHLRAVVTPTTGLNHIDLEAAAQAGVAVLALRGEVDFLREVRATAELTLGLMLALLRHLPQATAHVLDGGWDRDRFRGRELSGKVAGVVGYGRLGRMVAELLAAFHCEVLVHDTATLPPALVSDVKPVPLATLLSQSDLVTLHVNLTPANQGMFGRREFDAMKAGAWFINTSRGELVDEAALLEALRSGRLAGAATDVLRDEQTVVAQGSPLIEHARRHDNLLITPHLGGCTVESMQKTELFMARKLADWLQTSAADSPAC